MEVASTPKDHSLVGRESQIDEFYREYLIKARVNNYKVVSVWGTPGVGKSAFVRSLFGSNKVIDQKHFQKYAWVDVSHPFIVRNFFRRLHLELDSDSVHANVNPVEGCRKIILKGEWCLIVIDNIQSTEEWDMIESALLSGTSKTIVVVITTEASIALHCADKAELAFNVKCLESDAAFDVFKQENTIQSKSTVKEICGNHEVYKVITKCGGLPKVIISIACLLTKNPVKWKHIANCLNGQFIYYLENKTELTSLHDLFDWMRSYFHALSDDGSYSIRRRRLVMRWVAEGYFQDSDRNTAGEKGEKLFSDLLELSMIQQSCLTASTQMRIVLYKISSFFHEFIMSRPEEEGHCHPTNRRRGRHLVIEECWDRDKFVFENIDFSRLRSLTVFGKWESFLVSSNMKVLRVLDLEDASGVTNKDVEKILKLLCRLKFLSLRGCSEVTCLPSSLGDLRQLQILDVKGTSIAFLPKSITNLKRLQYIRSGSATPAEGPSPSCSFTSWLPSLCGACQTIGVEVPTGIEKLKAIHTLSVLNAGMCRGKTILKELQKLTQLHKLGVCGVNKKNCKEFCAAISCHVHLESLSVWLSKGSQDCLDDILPPLEKVLDKTQSLKLYGIVETVPAWIRDLPRLTKLELRCYFKVKILEIACSSKFTVFFGSEAMQNLELLTARCYSGSTLMFSEINKLSKLKLKEVRLLGSYDDKFIEDMDNQLKAHPRKPSLKLDRKF
ncbi:hypothetical protein HU200_053779 [Digitaria exilis]|uniref:NB-ARC domain-containing protein n=1 Tax=Digitaria exilis TaxID=1010633 RepID=A0A835ALM9_9POAL|nr:hypothetical protein HU200_053779 [Digitaria exilis]